MASALPRSRRTFGGLRHAGPGLGQEVLRKVEAVEGRPRARDLLQEDAGAAAQLEGHRPGAQAAVLDEELGAAVGAPPARRAVPVPDLLGVGRDLAVVLDLPLEAGLRLLVLDGNRRGVSCSWRLCQIELELARREAAHRRSSKPWRKREMLVSPYWRSW